jgi:predicted ATPase
MGTPAGTASARLDDLSVQMLMGDGRMKAILVADDDVGTRDLLRSALATAVADGTAVLRLLDSVQPDLIVLDVSLPGLDGVAVCTPQAETQALYEQLRAGPVAPPHNLPSLPGGFLGRERSERLAVQVATHYVQPVVLRDEHAFADGVYLVDLAGVGSRVAPGEDGATVLGQRLALASGRVLGVDFANAADPLPALARWLGRKRLLLVLDNVEYLLAGVGVLAQLLEQAPGLKALVTSRERLRLAEEWVLEVEGLARPGSPGEVERAPASQLFVQHAQQVGMSGPPTAAERAAIARICELTQGLPLALILAAHWRRALSCDAIVEELGRGLDLLTTPERGLPERQRSMRAVLARTWARLAPEEQAALRQLAVCRGGFTLEAARAVACVERVTLLALRDRALLGQTADGRYTLHELVRQYAAEQAATPPTEAAEAEARHARYYAALVEREGTALWQTPEVQKSLGAEIDNLQAAWAWAAAHGECGLLAQMRAGLLAWFFANTLEEPVLVYLTCYQVLRAAGDPRAESVLRAGYSLLIERATQFVDEERRAQFLDNLPAHRTLVHAWRDDSQWTMGAGEHDADARVAPRAFANRQPTLLRIVKREESS